MDPVEDVRQQIIRTHLALRENARELLDIAMAWPSDCPELKKRGRKLEISSFNMKRAQQVLVDK
jgi:hypothetical protein